MATTDPTTICFQGKGPFDPTRVAHTFVYVRGNTRYNPAVVPQRALDGDPRAWAPGDAGEFSSE
ncbi:hypothetical protein N9L68_03470 [bacterium]|nr:hypothetical protein [bacterium]